MHCCLRTVYWPIFWPKVAYGVERTVWEFCICHEPSFGNAVHDVTSRCEAPDGLVAASHGACGSILWCQYTSTYSRKPPTASFKSCARHQSENSPSATCLVSSIFQSDVWGASSWPESPLGWTVFILSWVSPKHLYWECWHLYLVCVSVTCCGRNFLFITLVRSAVSHLKCNMNAT